MPITVTALKPGGINPNSYIKHIKHSNISPHGSKNFELKDAGHDLKFDVFGSGFKYTHGIPLGGAIDHFVVTEKGAKTVDVDLSPKLKISQLVNPSSFANYFKFKSYVFVGSDGNDKFKSGWGRDRLNGRDGNDILDGNIGKDKIKGGDGNDTLIGNKDNDVLIGGLGTDTLSGGKGADRFVFKKISESVVGADRDVIINFHHNQGDRIHLSAIDADTTLDGKQAFTFIGDQDFSGGAGELRFADGLLQGDVDGDGAADFEVELLNVASLVKGDFIL